MTLLIIINVILHAWYIINLVIGCKMITYPNCYALSHKFVLSLSLIVLNLTNSSHDGFISILLGYAVKYLTQNPYSYA